LQYFNSVELSPYDRTRVKVASIMVAIPNGLSPRLLH